MKRLVDFIFPLSLLYVDHEPHWLAVLLVGTLNYASIALMVKLPKPYIGIALHFLTLLSVLGLKMYVKRSQYMTLPEGPSNDSGLLFAGGLGREPDPPANKQSALLMQDSPPALLFSSDSEK